MIPSCCSRKAISVKKISNKTTCLKMPEQFSVSGIFRSLPRLNGVLVAEKKDT